MNESITMRVKPLAQLQFIIDNYDEMRSSEIKELYLYHYQKALQKETGVSFKIERGQILYYHDNAYKFDYNDPVKLEAARFKDYIQSLGFEWRDLKVFDRNSYVLTSKWFKKEPVGDRFSWSGGPFDYRWLIGLLMELTEDRTQDDLNEADELLKDEVKGSLLKDFKLGNLTITTFQNGRIIIKGLTDPQQEKLDDLFKIKAKFRH